MRGFSPENNHQKSGSLESLRIPRKNKSKGLVPGTGMGGWMDGESAAISPFR